MAVEGITSIQAFGDPRLNARCLRLAASQARADGLIPAPVPYGLLPGMDLAASADKMVLLSANLFLPQTIDEYFLHSGSIALAAEMTPLLTNMLDAFGRWEDADGLIDPPAQHWNFVDCSFEVKKHTLTGGKTAVLNWLYVHALDGAARLQPH